MKLSKLKNIIGSECKTYLGHPMSKSYLCFHSGSLPITFKDI